MESNNTKHNAELNERNLNSMKIVFFFEQLCKDVYYFMFMAFHIVCLLFTTIKAVYIVHIAVLV